MALKDLLVNFEDSDYLQKMFWNNGSSECQTATRAPCFLCVFFVATAPAHGSFVGFGTPELVIL